MMKKAKKTILSILVALGGAAAVAQIPAPQINLTGNIGCQGFPCQNSGTLIFTSDANHTMTAQETSAAQIKVISYVALTAMRSLISPAGNFAFTIENATTGGQPIQIIGPSGPGVTIPSGAIVSVWNDGSGYMQIGAVEWPSSSDLIVSNGTNSPTGLAPVNGDCAVGAGSAWTVAPCGSGGSGVSSFTGDGELLNNSASTGAVTATLAATGIGYGVWGNTGSSSAAPAYHALSAYPAAAFPTLNQNTTGQAASVANSLTINASGTGAAPGATYNGSAPETISANTVGALALSGGTLTGALNGTSADFSGNVQTASFVGSSVPVEDIRAFGAVCNGTNDIGPAIQAAVEALPPSGGTIQIIGNPTACYWANPTTMIWQQQGSYTWTGAWQPNTAYTVNQAFVFGGRGYYVTTAYTSGTSFGATDTSNTGRATAYGLITLQIQGTLDVGTTLTLNGDVDIEGIGGYGGLQFQYAGNTAVIEGPSASTATTLGTAVTSTGVPTTVTPASMTGIYPGSIITIADTISCSASLTRTSDVVSGAFSAACHIPAGVLATVTGCSDSTFDGSFQVGASDYVANTIGWNQTAANSTATGCTVNGENEDSIESTNVQATTSTTATAVFARTHSASAVVGIGTLWLNQGGWHTDVRDIAVAGSGQEILIQPLLPMSSGAQANSISLVNVAAHANASGGDIANFALEISQAFNISIRGSTSLLVTDQSWSMRMTAGYEGTGGGSGSDVFIGGGPSFIYGGIKMDHGGGVLYATDITCENVTRGCVVYDPTNYWASVPPVIWLQNTGIQDNFNDYMQPYINQLYTTGVFPKVILAGVDQLGSVCYTNKYFSGAINAQPFANSVGGCYSQTAIDGIKGTYNDGNVMDGEIRGINAHFAPAVVPYATLPVVTSPASWPTSGGCTITTGQLAPDGTLTSGLVAAASTVCTSNIETYTVTPEVGDTILFGGWAYNPNIGGTTCAGDGGFYVDNDGSSHFQINGGVNANASSQDSCISGDWWHPVVGYATITSSDGTASQKIRFDLTAGASNESQGSIDYWMPFMIYIPASANIPYAEIMRWRAQLLHGVVDPGISAGYSYDTNYTLPGGSGIDQLTGDVLAGPGSGPQAATVVKVNGGSVPASACSVGTNSSSQFTASTCTGTGNTVLASSPTLVSPALGTPSAAVLTNATGLPLSTGVSGTLAIANGGSNATTAPGALSNLLGNPAAGTYAVTCSSASSCTASTYSGAQTIAASTAALGTSAIASGACASTVTVAASGVTTTDTIAYVPNSNPQSVTGYAASASGSLYIWAYPTSGDVNFQVCNNTSASITPGALTLNWRVTR